MNFGVRLPGPFRVGISSKGRVNVGMTAGPFSVSTGYSPAATTPSRPGAVRLAGLLDQHVRQAQSEGWAVTGRNESTAILRRGAITIQLAQAAPGIVEVSQVTSRSSVLIWGLLAVVIFGLCMWARAR